MSRNKNIISTCINYIPGFVILAFGMLAIYSTVQVIKKREMFRETYSSYGNNVQQLQSYFFDFEIAYHAYTEDSSLEKLNTLKEKFNKLNSQYETMLLTSNKYSLHADLNMYEKNLAYMRKNFFNLAYQISELKYGSQLNAQDIQVFGKNIDLLMDDILILNENFFQKIQNFIHSKESDARIKNLYWSVIMISLMGFLVVILNAYKLQELKLAEADKKQNLVELEKRQTALEASHDGIMITDKNGALTHMNPAFMRIHNIIHETRSDYIGKPWYNVYKDEELTKIKQDVMPSLKEHGYWRGEIMHNRADKTKIFTELSITELDDGGLIGTTLDISEEYRARQEKQELEEQFFQAQKMEAIGRLAGGIAHDFNNILAAMNGYAEFLRDDLESGTPQHKFALNILQAGRQARDLVDKMLAFSRRTGSAREVMDMNVSLHEVLSMLEASLPRTIEVISHFSLIHAPIYGNSTQISQTIMNLCVNAKDAMEGERGKLVISVDAVKAEDVDLPEILCDTIPSSEEVPAIKLEDGLAGQTRLVMGQMARSHNYIRLRVQDSGCGMSRVLMEHIFEPFFTTKPVDKGTGLGLSTVHGVLTSHQGMMIVDSTLGVGTIFDLYFPAAQSLDSFQNNSAGLNENLIKTDFAQKPARILVVEDQENLQEMMSQVLERLGYVCDVCSNGLEGLDMIREKPDFYDLVITDQNMPHMTGLELAQQAYLDFPHLPFILFSGYSQKEIQEIIENHSAIKATLRKPVLKEVLAQNVAKIIQANQKRNAA